MKITEIVKDWLRSKCGGNYHQVLGHLRAMPKGYGGPKEEVMLKVPIVVAGRRIKLQGTWDQFRALAQPATDDLFLSTFEKCLWPALPLRSFGNLFHGDQSPTTIRSELVRHYLQLKAWSNLQATRLTSLCRKVKEWILASDQSFECPYVYDTPWYRFLPGGPFPQRLGECKRAVESVPNPDWVNAGPERDVFFIFHPKAFDVIETNPPPKEVKLRSIDDVAGKPEGTFKKFVKASQRKERTISEKSVKRKKSPPRNQTSGRGANKRKAAK